MTYDTLNPVPSTDPRDLDDNAQAFDRFMQSSNTQEPDRLGVPRLTWSYVEAAATALTNPNVIGLASLTSGQYKVPMFNNSLGAMVTFDTGALGRTLAGLANNAAGQLAGRNALAAVGVGDNITGSAAKLTTARGIAATGDAAWSVTFDGSSDTTAALTLVTTGVSAGTYTRVTVDTKGRVTAGSTSALPVANGGTNATTATAARTNLSAAASGANADITSLTGLTTALSIAQGGTGATTAATARTSLGALAQTDKPSWTTYTPTVTAGSGTYTSISATGKYVVIAGICTVQITVTVTTKGTGTLPFVSLPVAALAGSVNMQILAKGDTAIGTARIAADLVRAQITNYLNADMTADGASIFISGSYPIA